MKALVLLTFLVLAACGGADYGYSRTYSPLDQENQLLRTAVLPGYEEVHTNPAAFRSQTIAWFGAVSSVEPGPNGHTLVHFGFRTHQDRHLCADETGGSCRVTVSDRSSGPFSALIALSPADTTGQDQVALGSLMRVFGSPNGDIDSNGGPVLAAVYYRHWPRGTWVTTADAGRMRR
jgi:hypothetical protein